MTLDKDELPGLLERVKARNAHVDQRLSYDVLRAILGRNGCHAWLYGAQKGNPHSSVDAALALVERAFPGCWYVLGKGKTRPDEPIYGAQILSGGDLGGELPLGLGEHDHSQALAILVALLSGLIADRTGSELVPDGRCPSCGEDEMDGGRCSYCGHKDYADE